MKIVAFTLLFFLIGLPKFVWADTTTVINNISASSNTGGNTAESGEVIQGKSEASVKVYTEVNGEVVEDFEKVVESVIGDVKVEYEAKTEVNAEGKTDSKVEVKVNDEVLEVDNDLDVEIREEIGFFKKIFNYVLSFFKF